MNKNPISIENFGTYSSLTIILSSVIAIPLVLWILYAIFSIVVGFARSSSPLSLFS